MAVKVVKGEVIASLGSGSLVLRTINHVGDKLHRILKSREVIGEMRSIMWACVVIHDMQSFYVGEFLERLEASKVCTHEVKRDKNKLKELVRKYEMRVNRMVAARGLEYTFADINDELQEYCAHDIDVLRACARNFALKKRKDISDADADLYVASITAVSASTCAQDFEHRVMAEFKRAHPEYEDMKDWSYGNSKEVHAAVASLTCRVVNLLGLDLVGGYADETYNAAKVFNKQATDAEALCSIISKHIAKHHEECGGEEGPV